MKITFMGLEKPYYRIARTESGADYILDKRYASDRFLLLQAYQLIENDLKAIVICNKVLEYAPQDLSALNGKAAALTNLHEYQEAMEIFDNVLKIDPKNADAIKNKKKFFKS